MEGSTTVPSHSLVIPKREIEIKHAKCLLVGGLVAMFYFPINIGFLIIPIDGPYFSEGWPWPTKQFVSVILAVIDSPITWDLLNHNQTPNAGALHWHKSLWQGGPATELKPMEQEDPVDK